jgi:hypothetical protein
VPGPGLDPQHQKKKKKKNEEEKKKEKKKGGANVNALSIIYYFINIYTQIT